MMRYLCIALLFSLILPQTDYLEWHNYPDLQWETIETEHFIIHYHDGTERTAREAATIAEYVYPEITELYEYYPDSKTILIITDYNDYSNGAAYYNFNKMIISARPANFYLRGAHRWLQNVITHEFTHIVQVGASLKYSRFIPYSAIQVISYADEKREDVVYGFPKNIISYPIASEIVPPWFAEGTAQAMYSEAYFDYWDSTRDMILRDRAFYNNLLSFDEMHSFGKSGMGHECIYNQGFSLVNYIVKNYGRESLKEITLELSKPFQYSMNKALVEAIGISGYRLYDNWKKEIEFIFDEQLKNIKDNKNYTIIESAGYSNFHPMWSPTNEKLAFISDKDNDYFGRSDLFIYDFNDSLSTKIQSGVRTKPAWLNDSLIVYAKRSEYNKNGSKFFNLYSYDLVLEEEQQLTKDMRLMSPIYHSQTKQIFAVNTFDGTSNIVAGNADFSSHEQLTNFNNGVQIFSLTSSDSLIIYDAVINHERNLFYLNIFSKVGGVYEDKEWDVRDPSILGLDTIHSNDKKGIFNLFYKNNIQEGYITNVIGGAFMPILSEDGRVAFSLYDDGKFNLAVINDIEFEDDSIGYDSLNKRSDFLDLKFNSYVPASEDYVPASEDYMSASEDFAPASEDWIAEVGTAQVGTAQVGTATSEDYIPASEDYVFASEDFVPASEDWIAEVGTAQVGTAQVGTAQVGTAQVGTAASVDYVPASFVIVGTAEVGTAASEDYVAFSEDYVPASEDYAAASKDFIPASEDYAAEVGTPQVGTAQVGTVQVGTAASVDYVPASEDFMPASEDYAAEVGTAQVGTAQVGTAASEDNESNTFYLRPNSNLIANGVNLESKPYKEKMMGMFFIPRLTIDYNTIKPGFYFFDNEYIGRTSIIGGLSMNSNKDLDFSMFFDYNKNSASYYFNFYWMTKHLSRIHPYINNNHEVIPSLNYYVDYKYELFSADIGSRMIVKNHKFWLFYTYSKYRQYNYPKLIQDFEFNGQNIEELSYSYANDYYRGHSITLDYNYDGRSKDFLYRYTMFPKNGFNLNASVSFKKNNLFEGFKANDQFGGFIEDLQSHDVVVYKLDLTNYWHSKNNKDFIIKNNILMNFLSKDEIDEFLYFFGGGLLGMKGYTYFEPTMQGTELFLISNTLTKPIFKEKSYKVGWIYLNSLSLSITHQFGKASNGSIKVYSGKFIESELTEPIKNYLQLSNNYDALDISDNIPDVLESYIYPDIYHRYDVVDAIDTNCLIDNGSNEITIDNQICNEYSITELKDRYAAIKHSIGLEIKLLGFSFYSYPTALTYEYHIPIEDPWNTKGQQYLRLLFDFADLKR